MAWRVHWARLWRGRALTEALRVVLSRAQLLHWFHLRPCVLSYQLLHHPGHLPRAVILEYVALSLPVSVSRAWLAVHLPPPH